MSTDRSCPRMCENAQARFSGVDFSHVDAISGGLEHRIRLLAILRDERNEFPHSLGRKRPVGIRRRAHSVYDRSRPRNGHAVPNKPNRRVSLSLWAPAASFAGRAPRHFVVPFA
jgi:hypothetical protein